uniref:Guanylate-binding protein N-terminal domain-containing protein n=1 Tax=Panagrolaimus sp. ES5 TaxID=591445 RepID=A0AC34FH59_9BILA
MPFLNIILSGELCLNTVNSKEEDQKQWKQDDDTSSKNSSTLSLHIAAYENSVEVENDDSDYASKEKAKTSKYGKTLKDVKKLFSDSSMNAVEIPRQPKDELSEPEVMQFKASQKLLNPNDQSNAKKGGGNFTGSPTSDYFHASQIVEYVKDDSQDKGEFIVKEEAIKKIFGNERVADLPLVALCIAGAGREGKSFILNFFLDYLRHKEKNPNEPWKVNEKTLLNGFEFRGGDIATTKGIWALNHIFVIEQDDGKKVAVSLIDSQGIYDNETPFEDCSTLFSMTCMFSSIMCFNVFTKLQEDKIGNLAVFVQQGKMISENLGGSGKLFQDLAFIVRDFQYFNEYPEENGGQRYIENVLGPAKNKQLQQNHDELNASCERKLGFVHPRPGNKVENGYTLKSADMNPKFVVLVKKMVQTLLPQCQLRIKCIGSTEMYCKDMYRYIPSIVQCFHDNKDFAPQPVHAVNRAHIINLEVERAVKKYEKSMNKAFDDCTTGYENEQLVDFHRTVVTAIQSEIFKRMQNENIRAEVIHRVAEQVKTVLLTYKEKNEMLVEKEKKRIQKIDEKEKESREHESYMKLLDLGISVAPGVVNIATEGFLLYRKNKHENIRDEQRRQHETEQSERQRQHEKERDEQRRQHDNKRDEATAKTSKENEMFEFFTNLFINFVSKR